MILTGKDEIIVTCSCGCDNAISFKKGFNVIWVSALSSDFYSKQLSFVAGIKNILHDFRNINRNRGKLYVSETVMKEQDVLDLMYTLENLINDMDNSKLNEYDLQYLKEKTKSRLHMTNIVIDKERKNPEWREYSIELESCLPVKDIIFHNYRQYEGSYSKKEIEVFLKRIKRMLKKEYDKNFELGTQILTDGMRFKNVKVLNFEMMESNKRYFNCKVGKEKYILTERQVLEREGFYD